ncbi:hypothetical protein C3B44_02280 [Corynebacterium yudongzhengii]|uniref:Uncharacterized protein n=1 Tax=Corynebacterium yudongzhengii TaxID=2080740 RepID=A0A2U1T706_9CORY|nr:hypothetical protein [Corynebacterium yudongzhengii]AWB81320.1 hypothetical protein C3B44_02280 [Corynebacterium yudongzhengii]PWC01763.1 hypothetical protein DF222_05365 [Corynebacterium yudongzhengii]
MRGTTVRKDLSGLTRLEQIDELRARMAAVTGEPAKGAATPVESPAEYALEVGLPAPLPRRGITECSECPALAVELIRQVTAAGGYVGVIGWADLSFAAVEHLDQVITIPDPGSDPLGIASILVEGLDLVILHSAVEMNLSPVRVRPLAGRLRRGQAALVLVGWKAPSPALTIDAHVSAYRGIGRGTGRITGYDIDVTVADKTHRQHATYGVGQRPRLRAV